jgi:hypothetical protein
MGHGSKGDESPLFGRGIQIEMDSEPDRRSIENSVFVILNLVLNSFQYWFRFRVYDFRVKNKMLK